MRKHERKSVGYMRFMDLEKAYERINRESWQLLKMFDVSGKLLNEIKNMHAYSLICVRVKGIKSNCFRIEKGER